MCSFYLFKSLCQKSAGLDSNPQEEFLSLLGGARTSPPIHQFLVNSLGEAVRTTSEVLNIYSSLFICL